MRSSMMLAGLAVTTALGAATTATHAEVMTHETVAAAAVDSPTDARLDRARQLRERAEALFSEPRQWRRAARLLERSAELRSDSDPEAYTCLLAAGRIRAATGDAAGAQRALAKAAAHAMARGAVLDAATAYTDAGYVAAQAGRLEDARSMFERAGLLAESPLLSAAQRQSVRERLPA